MQREQTNEVISLYNWPKKPLRRSRCEISPTSQKVIQSSGFSPRQILPISANEFFGSSMLNEEWDLDQLIQKFNTFNQKRQQKVQMLKSLRTHYRSSSNIHSIHQAHNNSRKKHNNDSEFNVILSRPLRIIEGRISHSEVNRQNPILVGLGKSETLQRFSPRHIQSVSQIDQFSNNMISFHQYSPPPPPALKKSLFSLSKKSSNDYCTESKNLLASKYKNQDHFHLNINNNNSTKKIIKTNPVTGNSNSKKRLQTQQILKNNKKIDNKNQLNDKRKGKQKKFLTNRNKQARSNYYGTSPTDNISTKKTIQKNSVSRKKIKTPIKRNKKSTKIRLTQNSNINPLIMNEYYDSKITQQLNKRPKMMEATIFMAPLLEQLTLAVDQLIQLTEKQQTEFQMLQNLNRLELSDCLQQKQKKRLIKIHQIERDQLKDHIYKLKTKLKILKKSEFVTVMNTL